MPSSTSFNDLPQDVVRHISKYLNSEETNNLSDVNINTHTDISFKLKIKKYIKEYLKKNFEKEDNTYILKLSGSVKKKFQLEFFEINYRDNTAHFDSKKFLTFLNKILKNSFTVQIDSIVKNSGYIHEQKIGYYVLQNEKNKFISYLNFDNDYHNDYLRIYTSPEASKEKLDLLHVLSNYIFEKIILLNINNSKKIIPNNIEYEHIVM